MKLEIEMTNTQDANKQGEAKGFEAAAQNKVSQSPSRLKRVRSGTAPWTKCQAAVGRTQLCIPLKSVRPSDLGVTAGSVLDIARAFTMTDGPAGGSIISFCCGATSLDVLQAF